MKNLLPRTKMLDEAKYGIVKHNANIIESAKPKGYNFIVEIFIFFAVLTVVEWIQSLVIEFASIPAYLLNDEYITLTQQFQNGEINIYDYNIALSLIDITASSGFQIAQLFTTLITAILVMIFCRFIEKRRLSSMGFRKNGAVGEYLVGMVIGVGIFSAAVGICLLTGSLEFGGMTQNVNLGLIGLFFAGFLIQGMSEETLCRGYFMVSLSRRSHVALAVLISSVAFGCLHLLNPGVHPLAIVNVSLFGIFAGVYVLKRGNIWGVCAIHSLWNFVQGNIYGIKVSGMGNMETLLTMKSVEGRELINGGEFGLEGGIAVTIVLIIGTVIVLLTKTKQSELVEAEAV